MQKMGGRPPSPPTQPRDNRVLIIYIRAPAESRIPIAGDSWFVRYPECLDSLFEHFVIEIVQRKSPTVKFAILRPSERSPRTSPAIFKIAEPSSPCASKLGVRSDKSPDELKMS